MPYTSAIPASNATVSVRIIDSTARLSGFPTKSILYPEIPGYKSLDVPSYAFLIEHGPVEAEKGGIRRVLFDLGVRKDWNAAMPPHIVQWLSERLDCHVERDVYDILSGFEDNSDQGLATDAIEAIILSHEHWDHTGTPERFPTSTKLCCSQGMLEMHFPGYPVNQRSSLLQASFDGRVVEAVDFEREGVIEIGGFRAIDYFDDGSFYLLDLPGHAAGHLGALARTTSQTFILLGADAFHHPGEIRPSEFVRFPQTGKLYPKPIVLSSSVASSLCQHYSNHLPTEVDLEPFLVLHKSVASCISCSFYHCPPSHSLDSPPYDYEENEITLKKLQLLDADENIWIVTSHDTALLALHQNGQFGFFPADANSWKKHDWKAMTRWQFLADFDCLARKE